MSARCAIYYSPEPASELGHFGHTWLADARYHSCTQSPRFYGFHGTLKAPFELAAPYTLDDVLQCAEQWAAQQQAFELLALEPQVLGNFVALMSKVPDQALHQLADQCVQVFDSFRAPLTPADLQKRPDSQLSMREAELRRRWGYPYVLDQYRFHMTLTDTLSDGIIRDVLLEVLSERMTHIRTRPRCDSICLFMQPNRATPFTEIQRFPFGGK